MIRFSHKDPTSVGSWEKFEEYAAGNMKRKLLACREAFNLGVSSIYLADGRIPLPLKNAEEETEHV